jgi:hypothetical protein
VCDVGIVSYTVYLNGSWQDAGLAPAPDDGGAGKVRNGGGFCQADSELDFGDPSVQLGGCRIQVSWWLQGDLLGVPGRRRHIRLGEEWWHPAEGVILSATRLGSATGLQGWQQPNLHL